ncbi:MAG: hypothetical protein KIT78_08735, partial [Steroidobacteraceae bacterium]|nr:hypothetical protein [Steroidobacteraceae bacterium]
DRKDRHQHGDHTCIHLHAPSQAPNNIFRIAQDGLSAVRIPSAANKATAVTSTHSIARVSVVERFPRHFMRIDTQPCYRRFHQPAIEFAETGMPARAYQ